MRLGSRISVAGLALVLPAVAAANQNPSIRPVFPVGTPNDLVAIRYKARVNASFPTPAGVHRRHIIFISAALEGATENGGRYALQTNIYNDGLDYDDLTQCEAVQPPVLPSRGRLIVAVDDQPTRCPSVIPPADAACPADGKCHLNCFDGETCADGSACDADRGICPGNTFCWEGATCPDGSACPANRGICASEGAVCRNGHIGQQTFSPGAFPRTSREIDALPGYTIMQANSDEDLQGMDLEVEIVRDSVFSFATPQSGWGERIIPDGFGDHLCSDLLPDDEYRAWDTWVTINRDDASSDSHRVRTLARRIPGTDLSDFMLASGQRAWTIVTEFLYNPSFFQVYLWDLEFRRDGSTVWESVDTFDVLGQDQTASTTNPPVRGSSGIRMAEYDGRSVVEISNDGTNTYFEVGDPSTFTLPADPAVILDQLGCAGAPPWPRFCLPTVAWDDSGSVTREDNTVVVYASVDEAPTQAISIPVIVGGTADSADHDLPVKTYLTIPAGSFTGTVSFTVHDNPGSATESPETVTLRLHAPPPEGDPAETDPVNDAKLGQIVEHTVTVLPRCGDGILDTGEQCDGGPCCTSHCQFAQVGQSCEDGNSCTTADACNTTGVCEAGSPLICSDDGNVCTDDVCDPATGTCGAPSAASCDDGDPCTVGDACAAGGCSPGVYSCGQSRSSAAITNLAEGQVATQASTLFGAVASRAVDGNLDGTFAGGSVAHTVATLPTDPWWEVDLGASRYIAEVEAWNRTDPSAIGWLTNYYVLISDAPFVSGDLPAVLAQSGVTAVHHPGPAGVVSVSNVGRNGRYVRVQLVGNNSLALAEVVVLGKPALNFALGQPATQASTLFGASASRAVDGNVDGAFAGGSVAHTIGTLPPDPWWEVDLGTNRFVTEVEVWNRTDPQALGWLEDYYVLVSWVPFVSGDLAAVLNQMGVVAYFQPGPAGVVRTTSMGAIGRYVRIQLPGNSSLALAEVVVSGPAP